MTLTLHEISKFVDKAQFESAFDQNVQKVISIIEKYGFDVRVVGGAVRDFLLKKSPRDIDLATDAEPAEIIFVFDLEGIPYDSTGISHGTVKAVFGDEKIDLTSISYKMRKQNGKIKIIRTNSWEYDSSRRDLTINSMSVDLQGKIYDYQNGIDDLNNQIVRFCSNPQDKIDQDPFVILRWFKAVSLFDNPKWPKSDQKIILRNIEKLSLVKDEERVKLLLAGLMQSKNYKQTLQLMCKFKAATYLNLTCDL